MNAALRYLITFGISLVVLVGACLILNPILNPRGFNLDLGWAFGGAAGLTILLLIKEMTSE